MYAEKQTAIETRFKDAGAPLNTLEKVYENTPAPSAEVYDEWARLTVQYGDGNRSQIGGSGFRYFGVVLVQIFLREGIGVARGVVLADAVQALFREAQFSGLTFRVPTILKVPFADKGWFQVQITAPFYFDEVT